MVTVSALKDRPLEVFLDESGAPVAQVEVGTACVLACVRARWGRKGGG